MVYVVPGVILLWGALAAVVGPHGKSAFWLGGAVGTAAMVGVQALAAGALGELPAAVMAYGVVALALVGAKRWAKQADERQPGRGKVRVRERRLSPAELGTKAAGHRIPAELTVAQSRAIALANRRAIRWKENP